MEAHENVGTNQHAAVATGAPHQHGFPWKHVIGYLLSLVLTFAAFWFVLKSSLPIPVMLTSIVILAIFQVFIQLLFFMHLTENHGPAFHTILLAFGFFIAITVVGGSIWIMGFSSVVA